MPTLLLDLDGTLVHSVPDLTDALNRLIVSRGLNPFEEAEVTAMVGDGVRPLLERAFIARGRSVDEVAHDSFLADYTAHSAVRTHPYPGAEAALEALSAKGWTLAVCTNKPTQAARALLTTLGLAARFAAITGADATPARKPDPAHLLAALAQSGGVATEAVMVGDHRNDMEAARRAGIPALFALWGYGSPEMAGDAPRCASFTDLAARLIPPSSLLDGNARRRGAQSPG